MGKLMQDMSLEEAKEYFSKYTNAEERVTAWKLKTGKSEEKKPAAKKEDKADE
jgi:hypothetical protein